MREEERTRIAREVHDELGQTLTSCKLDASWLAHHLPRSAYRARVLEKMVMKNNAELMHYAIQHRLVEYVGVDPIPGNIESSKVACQILP